MRPTPNLAVERYRVRQGEQATSRFDGNNGAFVLPVRGRKLLAIVNDGTHGLLDEDGAWEHVSVSVLGSPDETPTWAEMAEIKALFWDDEECVLQFHPPRSEYVNIHGGCLHLWRHCTREIALPARLLV